MSQARRHRRHLPAAISGAFCCYWQLWRFPPPHARTNPTRAAATTTCKTSRTHLWFDLEQRQVRGEVTESIAALRDNVSELKFDSVGLTIESVAVDGRSGQIFDHAERSRRDARASRRLAARSHEILIHYHGQPKKGLYFVLPDKNYPQQPREIWTQGEAEDTRYYIPLYDYPNDRTTSEMLRDRPSRMDHVSNGRLIGA